MFAPGAIDQWGYAYRAVQRPGVRVREEIGTDGGYPLTGGFKTSIWPSAAWAPKVT
jgi:hypothetical protein